MAGLLEDLPSDWRVVPFGEVVSDSAFGPRFSGELYADDGNVATLRTTDMDDDGTISYETMPLANIDTAKFQNHLLRKDDLVITRSGTCGIAGIFRGFDKPVLPGAFLIRLRLNEQADVRFFRYFFNSRPGRGHLLSIAAGAVQQNINNTNLKKLAVPLPPLSVQQRIAGILSAYDELIESSQRRIRILEAMARAHYRDRFLCPCQSGKRPRGWREVSVGEVLTLSYGKSLTKKNRRPGPYPVVGSSGISGFHDEYLVTGPGVVVGRAGSAGLVHWIQSSFFPIDSAFFAEPQDEYVGLRFIYFMLTDLDLPRLISGSAVPGINRNAVYAERVIRPSNESLVEFETLCQCFFDLKHTLELRCDNLRRTRDLLLPRLLSGQIEVEVA